MNIDMDTNASHTPDATLERWLTGPRFSRLPARGAQDMAPALSFEFFPPKTEALETQLWACIRRLEQLRPRFVSVTYGAGGTTQQRTHATVTRIVRETSLVPAAHLTCVGAASGEVDDVARAYWDAGVRHIVALRGDVPGEGAYVPHPGGYAYASDLVAGLKRVADFEITVAAYPEMHPAAANADADLDHLKRKLDAGAVRAITQYFFDADVFLRFLDRALAAGITAPIVPGIMPVSNFAQAASRAGVRRIIYLGGLGEMGAGLSQHLRSRREVEEQLASTGVPVTTLRAAMIIGAGSASFEILRYLVERLPIMITPRWVRACPKITCSTSIYHYLGFIV